MRLTLYMHNMHFKTVIVCSTILALTFAYFSLSYRSENNSKPKLISKIVDFGLKDASANQKKIDSGTAAVNNRKEKSPEMRHDNMFFKHKDAFTKGSDKEKLDAISSVADMIKESALSEAGNEWKFLHGIARYNFQEALRYEAWTKLADLKNKSEEKVAVYKDAITGEKGRLKQGSFMIKRWAEIELISLGHLRRK